MTGRVRAVSGRPSFNLHPLALLAAAFAFGILCARLTSPPLIVCVVGALCLTSSALAAFARGRLGRATLWVVAAFAAVGAVFALAEEGRVDESRVRRFFDDGRIASGEPAELTGVLERAPEVAPDGLLLSLRIERLRFAGEERAASGRVELFAPVRDARMLGEYDALELRRGARLRLMAALERDEGYRNPGVSPFTEYLERRDVDARGQIKSPLLIERLDDERTPLPLVWLDRWRAWLLARFKSSFSRDTAGVLAASMLGNRLHLSRETAARFREGGTFHVLVISGLHITFVGGFVWALVSRLTKRRAWQWAASTLFVWAYAVAVGAESSVVRAALMFTVAALAPALGRPSGTLNALGAAALALLAARPSNLFDPSFQLTFLSVSAIVALAWPALTKLKETGEWRPRDSTPYPPACPTRLREFAEILFWSERRWRRDMKRATHSYVLFKTPLAARLERWKIQTPLRYAFATLLVSACVQLAMLPFFVVYFHRVSPASLVLNVFVGALMAVLSFAALAAVGLAQMSERLAAPFARLAETANALMTHGVDPFSAAGIASVRLPEYAGAASVLYALYYLPLVVLVVALFGWTPLARPAGAHGDAESASSSRRRILKMSAVAYAVLLVVIVSHPFSAARPDGRLRIDFLDVGQADAALVTMPDGTTLLVDGGGRARVGAGRTEEGEEEPFERDARGVGEAAVSEYLWWRGLGEIDFILATHADADHIDGLNDVARNFRVGSAFVARRPSNDPEFARFSETLRDEEISTHVVGRGDRMRFGEVMIDVLWPPLAAEGTNAPSRNDDSIVLRVRLGRRTFLLTGDIERRGEGALDAALQDARGLDVVKVAHHGSKTSSSEAFVRATSPAFAVISVARDSPYGHPHPDVVCRWRAIGAEVMTTGARGMITFSTDGEDLRVETRAVKDVGCAASDVR